jgi:hypothetical protein
MMIIVDRLQLLPYKSRNINDKHFSVHIHIKKMKDAKDPFCFQANDAILHNGVSISRKLNENCTSQKIKGVRWQQQLASRRKRSGRSAIDFARRIWMQRCMTSHDLAAGRK